MWRPWKTMLLCAGLPGMWWDASRWSLVVGPKGESARRDGGWRSAAEYWAQGHLGEECAEVDDRRVGPCPRQTRAACRTAGVLLPAWVAGVRSSALASGLRLFYVPDVFSGDSWSPLPL